MTNRLLHLSETRKIWVAAASLALLAVIAYQGSFGVPFILDDIPTIQQNPTIRQLWPLTTSLMPLHNSGITSAGRPLVNLSLAVNYALGNFQVLSYHIFNLFIHLCAGWTLMGLIRRTLLQKKLLEEFGHASVPLSAVIGILWLIHPLNTESVTYIVQRAEMLAGLFCLLTLYCFVRGTSSGRIGWMALSILAGILGVASKETGAMIPLIVFLYDRTFVAEDFRRAWQLRWKYYLALASIWILQCFLILGTGNRGGTAGHLEMPWWKYTITQAWAITNYLKLAVWPHPLIFDYGTELITDPMEIAIPLLAIAILLGINVYCLIRRPALGFAGACFFVILAPSSSFIPVITQTMAEHRMYLPLAIVISLAVLGIYRLMGRYCWFLFIGLIMVACVLTQLRNDDYQSAQSIWQDTLRKRPENARAWDQLGAIIGNGGNYPLALQLLDRADTLRPLTAEVHFNAGYVLAKMRRYPEAAQRYVLAIKLRPTYYQAFHGLGFVLLENKHYIEAIQSFKEALRINPEYVEAHYDLGNTLLEQGKKEEAIAHFKMALQINPDFLPAHAALALVTKQVK